ncbi:uncharacterized protein [Diadema setosum]|uniref:uncharacterized protein n=1 Tax=Diadema setosum TaxID=31175 RepID=UPI003B3B8E19
MIFRYAMAEFCLRVTSMLLFMFTLNFGRVTPLPSCSDEPACSTYGYYIGCYKADCVRNDHRFNRTSSITLDNCTASCRDGGYPFAGISNGTVCTCGYEFKCFDSSQSLNLKDNCGIPCPGDPKHRCGGWGKALVYIVSYSNISTPDGACDEQPEQTFNWLDYVVYFAAGGVLILVVNVLATCCIVRRCKRRRTVALTASYHARSEPATFTPHMTEVNLNAMIESPLRSSTLPARTGRANGIALAASSFSSRSHTLSSRRNGSSAALQTSAIDDDDSGGEYTQLQHHYQKQIYMTPFAGKSIRAKGEGSARPAERQDDTCAMLRAGACYSEEKLASPHLYDVLEEGGFGYALDNGGSNEGAECSPYTDMEETLYVGERNSPGTVGSRRNGQKKTKDYFDMTYI